MPEALNEERKARLVELVGDEQVKFDEPMSEHTSIRVGGPADAWVTPDSLEALAVMYAWAREERLPVTPFGRGSNVIVKDGGIRGIVLSLKKALGEIEVVEEGETDTLVRVGAGVSLPKLVVWAEERGLGGLAWLAGIPATVGGAVAGNAGTKDGEIAAVVEELEVMGETGKIRRIPNSKLKFSYRHLELTRHTLIVRVTLRLQPTAPQQLKQLREATLAYRSETQPLDMPSCGSVFKNPPKHKAGKLLEEAELKGVRVRNAMISDKHANWIVNLGGAEAADVLALIKAMTDKVRKISDIKLEREVQVLGEDRA